jgi:hypothetical protein
VYIASDDGIEPNGTAVTKGYVTYEGGVFTKIAVFAPVWGEAANGFYECHRLFTIYYLLFTIYHFAIYNLFIISSFASSTLLEVKGKLKGTYRSRLEVKGTNVMLVK